MAGSRCRQAKALALPARHVTSCDYHLTPEDLRRISARGRDLMGLNLGEAKRQMIYSRLSRRLRALGMTSFSAYLDFLETADGTCEIENFRNALTTNLTSFFREGHHFDYLEYEIRNLPRPALTRLRVWSAGCSTGEEAYTIAMILHANADALGGRDWRVLATDVDTGVLATAMRGSYAADRLKVLPPRFRSAAFIKRSNGIDTVSPNVRELVIFRALNLIYPWPFKGQFNIIFCRNVLVYLTQSLRIDLVNRFVECLQPGGLLFLGHSEAMLGNHPQLVSVGHTVYRRSGA